MASQQRDTPSGPWPAPPPAHLQPPPPLQEMAGFSPRPMGQFLYAPAVFQETAGHPSLPTNHLPSFPPSDPRPVGQFLQPPPYLSQPRPYELSESASLMNNPPRFPRPLQPNLIPPVDRNDFAEMFEDYEMMKEFKIARCEDSTHTDQTTWQNCRRLHAGENNRRRDLQKGYSEQICQYFLGNNCNNGNDCMFAHGQLEKSLHSMIYKTQTFSQILFLCSCAPPASSDHSGESLERTGFFRELRHS